METKSTKSRTRFTNKVKYDTIMHCMKSGSNRKDIYKNGINKHLVSKWLRQKNQIINTFESSSVADKKSLKGAKYPEIDQQLKKFVEFNASKGGPVSNLVLEEKVRQIREKMNIPVSEKWRADGYLQKFKQRQSIHQVKSYGDADSVPQHVIDDWIPKLKSLTENYDPKDVFNADEFGLFWQLTPSKSYVIRGQRFRSGKKSKERVSVLICSNADGSEKLKPLVIGKYKYAKQQKPVIYHNNSTAWMTASIFKSWASDLNQRMAKKNRKILLFLDGFSGHEEMNLSNVKMHFFPPNTTSVLQPMDQGIIKCVKSYYRQRIVRKIITELEKNPSKCLKDIQFKLVPSLYWLLNAWNNVKESAIQNCFRKAHFFKEKLIQTTEIEHVDDSFEILKELGIDSSSFEEFVSADDGIVTTEPLNDLTIEPNDNSDTEIDSEIENSDSEDCNDLNVPSFVELFDSIEKIKLYVMQTGISVDIVGQLEKFEDLVLEKRVKDKYQSKITDFFHNI